MPNKKEEEIRPLSTFQESVSTYIIANMNKIEIVKYHYQNTTLKYFLRIPEDKFDVMFFLITVGRNALTDGVPDPPHGASGLQSRLQTFSLGR